MKDLKMFTKDFISFLDSSPCSFYAVNEMKKRLENKGFKELKEDEKWILKKKSKYFITKNDSSIIAFQIGNKPVEEKGFHIIGSHSDSPGFKIKPNPEMTIENNYLKLNTEVYGGAILSTWFDRALSVAGRVIVESEDIYKPKTYLVNIDKDLMVIPNICIHMNREVNDGVKINPQKDTLPFLGMIDEKFNKDNFLINLIAKELKISSKKILNMELFLYDREGAKIVGLNEDMIHSGRLDNLAMAHASLNALIQTSESDVTKVVTVFDNEEVGSLSKQGAGSSFLSNVLRRIVLCTKNDNKSKDKENKTEENFFMSLGNSFLISADLAHALHPNYSDKHDPTNRPIINKGVAIKIAANQAYTSDAYSTGIFINVCKKSKTPYQFFVNRSDMRGGTTIGPITTSKLEIPSVDIGTPILGMHSVRELGGIYDHYNLFVTFKKFFE